LREEAFWPVEARAPRPCGYNLGISPMKKTKGTSEQAVREVCGQSSAVAAIQQGLDQAMAGLGRAADDVFDDLERELCERKPTREAESVRRA
jgi:hypothetical protein